MEVGPMSMSQEAQCILVNQRARESAWPVAVNGMIVPVVLCW